MQAYNETVIVNNIENAGIITGTQQASNLPPPTTDTSDTMTIDNWAGWTWSGADGVVILFSVNGITGTPGSGTNIGTGVFVQGPCGA